MRFTEENLKKFRITKKGTFRNINGIGSSYYYHYACEVCGYPHLSTKKNSRFCSKSCSKQGKNSYWYGKTGELHPTFGISKIDELSPTWKGGYRKNNIPTYDTFAHQLESYGERCIRDPEDPAILNVFCTYSGCKKQYRPTRVEVYNRIQGINNDTCKFYCCDKCKQVCPLFHMRAEYLEKRDNFRADGSLLDDLPRLHQHELKVRTYEKDDGICQRCGIEVTLYTSICHHEVPVVINGLISLDDDNAWTLCFDCDKHSHSLPGCGYSEIRKRAQELRECKRTFI